MKRSTSVRNKLLVFSLSIVGMMLALSTVMAVLHLAIVGKYEEIATNIFNQNALISDMSELISSYNIYRNAPIQTNLDAYEANKQSISDLLSKLDASVTNPESRVSLESVRNTIANVEADTDAGIEGIRTGDIQGTSAHYAEANRKFYFVRTNVADLLLKEINGSAALEAETSAVNRYSFIFGGLLMLGVTFFSLLVAGYWGNKLTFPLMKLAATAKKISGGDLATDVDADLLDEKDEVGSLSRSFEAMIGSLRRTIEALKHSNEETLQAKAAAEDMVKLRTRELSDERARLLASINSLSFGFSIADLGDGIVLRNPALDAILEAPADRQLKSIADIAALLGMDDLVAHCHESVSRGKLLELKDISYGRKFLRIFAAPVSDKGRSIGYVFLVEDTTEAKIMERSRDEFFAVASHELRTPLTAIGGNIEMIMDIYGDKKMDKDLFEMLTDIRISSKRLIEMVNDFLEVSRLEQGRIDIKSQTFDMGAIIGKVVRDFQTLAREEGLTLAFLPPAEKLPAVFADPARAEQVLVNLIGNALKFTKEGHINVEAMPDGSRFLKVRVSDTGVGISEHNQALLFRKFQQAGERTLARDVTQGTGLGLYICKLIMNNMGGSITLEHSEPGKGSAFVFTLPTAA